MLGGLREALLAGIGLQSTVDTFTPGVRIPELMYVAFQGAFGGLAGFWGVGTLKRWLRADDTLDVFGIHGVCGIVGALLTGVFSAPSLGGSGGEGYAMAHQLRVQLLGFAVTLAWSALVATVAFLVARALFGLRVHHDAEREGLDISTHGESAYDA